MNHRQIGQRIRELRLGRGISMKQLARQVDLHYTHLSKVENGKDPIGRESLIRIAEALDADVDLLLGEAGFQPMPLRVLGRIAAGVPIEAIEDYDTFDFSSVFSPEDHFLLRVTGDSMILAGIADGDLAIIRKSNTAENGDIVVAIVGENEATLKEFRRRQGRVALIPANDQLEEMIYPAHEVEIRGLLVGVLRTAVGRGQPRWSQGKQK